MTLDPGGKLIVYTNGIGEARRRGELFGADGIRRVLRPCGRQRPQDVVDALVSAAKEWAPGNLSDDTVLVAIKREARP